MTNPPGAMPPLPEPFGHIHDGNGNQPLSFDRGPIPWERSIGCSTQEVYSFAQLQAYAAPLIARVAELEAERGRIERNRDMWKGQCERQAEQLTAMRKSLAFFVIHPGVWQLCSPDSEVMREAKASIDAAIAAKD